VFLGQLPNKLRDVAVLRYLDELTLTEIAQELGITRQTAATRVKQVEAKAQRFRAQAGLPNTKRDVLTRERMQ
jgi:RNA polymerase sigma factor (sigma-70 family)